MKKTILTILLIGILVLEITGCVKVKEVSNTKISSDGDITLSIKEDTLTNTGVTLLLTNNTDKTYSYGNPFWIEKEQDGKWYKLKAKEGIAFTLPAYGIKSGEVKKWDLDWEDMYGKLTSGTYRIIKSVDIEKEDGSLESFNLAVLFNIDSD